MLSDVYSLGQGPVHVHQLQTVFGLNNYQVILGYPCERIPKEALLLATGPLGKWRETPETPYPLMEIVYANQGTELWKKLPKMFRTPDMRVNGQPHEMEPVHKRSLERKFYPDAVRPMREKLVLPKSDLPPPDISLILPDFIRSLELGLSPRPIPAESKFKDVETSVAEAPKIKDYTSTVMMDGVARPVVPEQRRPEPSHDAAPDGCCTATKANGNRCLRPGTVKGRCGAHKEK